MQNLTLRRKPLLRVLAYSEIVSDINFMAGELDEIGWWSNDPEFMNALEGDDDLAVEFQLLYSELMDKVETLQEKFDNPWSGCVLRGKKNERRFNDYTVALFGNSFEREGYNYGVFDEDDPDMEVLDEYDEKYAVEAAKKRILRMSKKDMLESIGTAWCILLEYLDVKTRFQNLDDTFKILRGDNSAILEVIKKINEQYAAAADVKFDRYEAATRKFDSLLQNVPDLLWVG